jgi:hypothetical protein
MVFLSFPVQKVTHNRLKKSKGNRGPNPRHGLVSKVRSLKEIRTLPRHGLARVEKPAHIDGKFTQEGPVFSRGSSLSSGRIWHPNDDSA